MFSLCCCNAAQSVCQRRARHKTGASEHARGSGTSRGVFGAVRMWHGVVSSRLSQEESDHTLPKIHHSPAPPRTCARVP